MLDWIDSRSFASDLSLMVAPTVVLHFSKAHPHLPGGHSNKREARLESWGPGAIGTSSVWMQVERWWLAEPRGANTPNWDFAARVTLDGAPGLLLIEAKANVPELGHGGKAKPSGSAASQANDIRIRAALNEASLGLSPYAPEIALSADTHYQLSNRLAFGWKLASLGIPTVLVYLGFLNDEGIKDAGEPLPTQGAWVELVAQHADAIGARGLFDKKLPLAAPLWVLAKSRPAISNSPLAKQRQPRR